MKKLLSLLLSASMLFALAACGSTNGENGNGERITGIGNDADITVGDSSDSSFVQDENAELADIKVCVVLAATLGGNPAHDNVVQSMRDAYANDDGITIDILESQTTSDWEPNLIAAANKR